MSEMIVGNDSNFDNLIEDSRTIIVDFWSPTCAPCKLIEPGLKKIAINYKDKIKVIKINVNESPRVSSRYMVRSVPTILFIKDRNVKTQLVGAVNQRLIEKKALEIS